MNSRLSQIVIAILIIGLGLLALFFGVQYNQLKKVSETYLSEKNEVNVQYDQLNSEFDILRAEFDELEDKNYLLTGDIESKRKELEAQKQRISQLLRKERLTKTELDQARAMIKELKNEKNALLTQLKSLGEENLALKEENNNYSKSLTAAYEEKKVLVAKQDSLVTQTKQLENEKVELVKQQTKDAPKVEFAQVVPIRSISAGGVKYKSSGKEKETDNYKRVDKIKVNFTVEKNPVATNGTKEYLIRILSPQGTVIYDKGRGSGEFVGSEENEGMKYTGKTNINYTGEEKNLSFFWRQDMGYEQGIYTAEVYNRGYLVGSKTFELK